MQAEDQLKEAIERGCLPLPEGMTFNWLLFVWGQLSPKPKWRPAARDLMTMEMYDRKVPVAGWFA